MKKHIIFTLIGLVTLFSPNLINAQVLTKGRIKVKAEEVFIESEMPALKAFMKDTIFPKLINYFEKEKGREIAEEEKILSILSLKKTFRQQCLDFIVQSIKKNLMLFLMKTMLFLKKEIKKGNF